MLVQLSHGHHAFPAPLICIIAGSVVSAFKNGNPVTLEFGADALQKLEQRLLAGCMGKCLFKRSV